MDLCSNVKEAVMDKSEILKQINTIFIDVLDNPAIALRPETVAADVEEWDSLTHIQLIVAVEKHFRIRFTTSEVQGLKNVGHLCDEVDRKLQAV